MKTTRTLMTLLVILFGAMGAIAQAKDTIQMKDTIPMKDNDNRTALEVYDIMKVQGRMEKAPRVNISGYAVKVGPDVYGLPSVEVSEKKGGKVRTLCVLPFMDYLKLRHVSKGDKVVMNGEVRGYTEKLDIVVVKECKIVSVNDKKL